MSTMASLTEPRDTNAPIQRQVGLPAPCPVWCVRHKYDGWHVSDWRTWEAEDSPRFELQLVRHDETDAPYPDSVGQTDFTVRVVENRVLAAVDADGFLLANDLRKLAAWLADLADEGDPHGLNGEPLVWHTERAGA